jgi:hypothetical protein
MRKSGSTTRTLGNWVNADRLRRLVPRPARRNRLHLRVLMTRLLGDPRYIPGQMTSGLRRLCVAWFIRRFEHTNRYVLTANGICIPVFHTKG